MNLLFSHFLFLLFSFGYHDRLGTCRDGARIQAWEHLAMMTVAFRAGVLRRRGRIHDMYIQYHTYIATRRDFTPISVSKVVPCCLVHPTCFLDFHAAAEPRRQSR